MAANKALERKLTTLRRRMEEAQEQRDNLLLNAYDNGATLRDLAALSGLSHSRIHQVVKARYG